ncbi:SAM-dependent methyltransferase [Streptomyces montanisoli]|uniref:SAM-dependent methyltransferase n=1 Tax=Streptomyces montanisoli TaxID=2798581 RepID=A0A940MFA5_9ACTN|nr:SAM-dependent methyltransferase [Streptomyces montanisoli]MBP0458945.1 SAM-dependent methyltransferase [Streptomyces montanisoli]
MTGTPNSAIDSGSRPRTAGVYDYLLGGNEHYRVDREVGERLPAPTREGARQNRAFMHRAVGWLARQGVDQFLDIGTGFPAEPNLHQIAQGVNPAARVLYVDNNRIVLRYAEALLVSHPDGVTGHLQADVCETAAIIEGARATLDLRRPLALSLIGLLHFLPDSADPHALVAELVRALPSGSHLVVSHAASDLHAERAREVIEAYRRGGIQLVPRDRATCARFFDGLDLVEPGLVTVSRWFRDTAAPAYSDAGVYAGVARVP